ncbi:hypothetical protein [Parasulfitobacter algicola]|uniref:Uncharacterized protein n=1 Tax=Parasulfitobacter algicola TaxID=2614809 RepID=A0ABX2IWE7_9RHOB|nr:hypothetical protein [Sulfitobacter algicola]NSX56895.1 hypothetical protein [Sulfitobacter algicola]
MATPEETRLRDALSSALHHYEEVMNTPFPGQVVLSVIDHPEFCAFAHVEAGNVHLQASTGTVSALDQLWQQALQNTDILQCDGQPAAVDPQALTQVSLIWLLFHELEHFGLGHFEDTQSGPMIEAASPQTLGLITSAVPAFDPENVNAVPTSYLLKRQEMEADHEAIELVLEAYSADNWIELRSGAACISAVMILIEKTDEDTAQPGQSHPKAATRLFQLLGHLTQLWQVPAQIKAQLAGRDTVDSNGLPPDDEIAAYQRQVIIPVFADALCLAKTVGASNAVADLQDQVSFFQDIANVQLGRVETLVTPGAMEWAELVADAEAG